ncbi:uncharacterized protein LOC102498400 isoform X1 [Tupaia chinensis]|uniref:uncharacterized protein LOC102498400 isoform X1 n=1 Tax=Tupaia chinensis TaxID=246437 RepID=UPI000FFCC559|nr:uncharacterized protein LOC102498400 isoform X1 [Tupaia chinensis]
MAECSRQVLLRTVRCIQPCEERDSPERLGVELAKASYGLCAWRSEVPGPAGCLLASPGQRSPMEAAPATFSTWCFQRGAGEESDPKVKTLGISPPSCLFQQLCNLSQLRPLAPWEEPTPGPLCHTWTRAIFQRWCPGVCLHHVHRVAPKRVAMIIALTWPPWDQEEWSLPRCRRSRERTADMTGHLSEGRQDGGRSRDCKCCVAEKEIGIKEKWKKFKVDLGYDLYRSAW